MEAVEVESSGPPSRPDGEPQSLGAAGSSILVIGNGMAGARLAEEIRKRPGGKHPSLTVIGDEPRGNYNRILLSSVLGQFKDVSEIVLNPIAWYEQNGIALYTGARAKRIDRVARRVVVADVATGEQRALAYDQLVLAMGSRPHVPPIDGIDKRNVFTFRTLDDCGAIAQAAQRSHRAVVLGGGLLGLEAARGLRSHGLPVTVVELGTHLMQKQLDSLGAQVLQRRLEAMGIAFVLGKKTTALLGEQAVTGLAFADGGVLETDMVVVSTGIRPNIELARNAGLAVGRAIQVDDQLRTSDPSIYAVGECAEHRGTTVGLVEPVYEQAKVLAEVLLETATQARYEGSRPVTVLKVMGVDVVAMGEAAEAAAGATILSHVDADRGTYRKLILRDGELTGAIVLGESASVPLLTQLFRDRSTTVRDPLDLLRTGVSGDNNATADVTTLPDDQEICNCHGVRKQRIVDCIAKGASSVGALGSRCKAGTGCGSCQPLLAQLISAYASSSTEVLNPVEQLKRERDGLDVQGDIARYAASGAWQEISETDVQRMKWHGLFLRQATPGHFMLRLRSVAGQMNAAQWRTIADLSDEYGKGFCDLTTRQQVQMRWFRIGDVPEIGRRLTEVGLTSLQTGMDNVRGICGCPAAGLTPKELLDASPIARQLNDRIVGNRAFTNLPRKFNVTITGCLENCCHPETQDIGLIPARKEIQGAATPGFNVLVGGKQGSGGYRAAQALDVFVLPEEAAELCAQLILLYRDHGPRALRNRARMAFLVDDRGLAWLRRDLARRMGKPLLAAGRDARETGHTDHVGLYRQRRGESAGPGLNYIGLLVPVGRITSPQMRGVAALAERYGTGEIRLTPSQNVLIPHVPDARLGALLAEPLLSELDYSPSPIMRGLVSCTGTDYCNLALIETKTWAIEVARALEKRLGPDKDKIAPLRMHWSGCPAGCGLHQSATIGLLGRRIKVEGSVAEAASVFVGGQTGPQAKPGSPFLHDVPCEELADALLPVVRHYRRKKV